jgi:uncharacterized protein (TIGR03067 family)
VREDRLDPVQGANMVRIMGLAVLALGLAGVSVQAQKVTGDLKKMQGSWVMVSLIENGKEVPAAERQKRRLTIKGNVSTLTFGKEKSTGTYKLDESKKPRTLDITLSDGEDKGKKMLGIYEFRGEQLRICLAEVGGKRPTKFESTPGSFQALEVWKKAK